MTQSGNVLTTIANGKLQTSSDKGAGVLFGTLTSGRSRDEARILRKGERGYVNERGRFSPSQLQNSERKPSAPTRT